jgi:RND family efflux transporter MFP subunit
MPFLRALLRREVRMPLVQFWHFFREIYMVPTMVRLLLGVLIFIVGTSSWSAEPAAVHVSLPVSRVVTDYADYSGRTQAVESVDIRARVTGYIDKTAFKEGAIVKAGDLLFEIDPRPYKAQYDEAEARVKLAEAQLKLANATLARDQALAKGAAGAVSRQQLDQDQAAVDEAKARMRVSEASLEVCKLNLDFTKVRSPISGQISRCHVTQGNLVVQDQTLLTTVVSRDPMHVFFDMDEQTLLRCRRMQGEKKVKEGKLPLLMGLADEMGLPHQGVLDFVDNQVDPKTGTVRLRGVFANADQLMVPGLFARVRLPLGEPYKALLVSEAAVYTEDGKKYLLVVDDKDVVRRREVKVGTVHDGLQVIAAGLQPTDRVVLGKVKGAQEGEKVVPQLVEMPMKKVQ